MIHETCKKVLFGGLALVLFLALPGITSAAARNVPGAKPGNCAACHKGEKVLPANHGETKSMTLKQCRECHSKDNNSLVGKFPLGHLHGLAGVTCAKCHGKQKVREQIEMSRCVECHGSTEKLAERTARIKAANPHKSPHYGTDLDCNACHHAHRTSEDYCAQCHKFGFKVP